LYYLTPARPDGFAGRLEIKQFPWQPFNPQHMLENQLKWHENDICTKTGVNGNRLSGRTERRLSSDRDQHQYPILTPRRKPSPTETPGWL
jgi:hypothetical protein